MWATLAMAAVLSLAPAQTGPLKLSNDRVTYGMLGTPRTDPKVLPGDLYIVAFDIENLKAKDDGVVRYSMGMEMTNAQGKLQFKNDPQENNAVVSLGGNRLPAYAQTEIGTDTMPGEYILKVTVKDLETMKTEQLVKKLEVAPKGFGLVRVQLTYLHAPLTAPPFGVVGQSLLLNGTILGFERNKTTKKPELLLEFRILDETGAATVKKTYSETLKEVPETATAVPIYVPIDLNRPGKFTAEMKVTDQVAGKSTRITIPFTVMDTK